MRRVSDLSQAGVEMLKPAPAQIGACANRR